MTAALAVGLLLAAGVYLVLQRTMLRVVVGFVLLGHAVNLLVLAAGGSHRRGLPLPGQNGDEPAADPLPQAFVLTAIVITFAITVYLLGLARAGRVDPEDDDGTVDDPGTASAGVPVDAVPDPVTPPAPDVAGDDAAGPR
ncbi:MULTISPECIES: sodium:proton antiporter [unclassified Modestobacter]